MDGSNNQSNLEMDFNLQDRLMELVRANAELQKKVDTLMLEVARMDERLKGTSATTRTLAVTTVILAVALVGLVIFTATH